MPVVGAGFFVHYGRIIKHYVLDVKQNVLFKTDLDQDGERKVGFIAGIKKPRECRAVV